MPATALSDLDTVILAGGRGTRLRALFPDLPKVLVPVAGRPFLDHQLDWLQRFGARRVILALGYRAALVQEHLAATRRPGLTIETFVEPHPLGTGGAVRAVLPQLRSEPALVANGDSLTRVDLGRFLAFHRAKSARLSMVLTRQPVPSASGYVETDADGAVHSFVEKPADRTAGGQISVGLYLLNRDVLAGIPAGRAVSIEREVFPRHCGRGFYALAGEFPFIDIGTAESLARAAAFLQEATA